MTQLIPSTIQFLKILYEKIDPEQFLEIRRITTGQPTKIEFYKIKDLDKIDWEEYCRTYKDENIYFGLLPRVSKQGIKRNITHSWGYWADVDAKPENFPGGIKEILDRCKKWFDNLPPTMIILSGHGVHFYWLLTEPIDLFSEVVRDCFERTGEKISKHILGGDKVGDLPRIFRLPGSRNVKTPGVPVECKIAYYNPENVYTEHDFEHKTDEIWDKFNGNDRSQQQTPTAIIHKKTTTYRQNANDDDTPTLDKDEKWIASTISAEIREGKRNTTVTRLAGYCCKKKIPQDIALEIIRNTIEHRCNPAMDAGEMEQTVESVYSRYFDDERNEMGIRLKKINAPTPYYEFSTAAGLTIELTLDELMKFSLFERKYFSVANSFPAWITKKEWKGFITTLSAEIQEEEVPKEASQEEAYFEVITAWLEHAEEATDPDTFRLGYVIRKDGNIYFNSQQLWEKFRQEKINLPKEELYKILRNHGAGHKVLRAFDKTLKTWYIKEEETQK
ncbi:MAG TPA: primase alpha helix C-terminal domain-containing protein [Clostridia bacterium]|nr:primase alpha helix C-terminal domain-containing protein [Clostridia bacterium]